MIWRAASLHFPKFLVYFGIMQVVFMLCFIESYPQITGLACVQAVVCSWTTEFSWRARCPKKILTIEDGTDTLSRNVGNKLPYAAPQNQIPLLHRGGSLESRKVTQLWLNDLSRPHISRWHSKTFIEVTNLIVIRKPNLMYIGRPFHVLRNITVKPNWQFYLWKS